MKKSNIYTCTGDNGTTSLVGGKRLLKCDVRIEAYGSTDELNAQLGLLCADISMDENDISFMRFVQNKLFNIGAYLATDNPNGEETQVYGLCEKDIILIEDEIDRIDSSLPKLRNFVLPGGGHAAALSHVCRTMCRRSERCIIALAQETYINPLVLRFINRLSDFLFVFARFCNVKDNIDEIFWDKDC